MNNHDFFATKLLKDGLGTINNPLNGTKFYCKNRGFGGSERAFKELTCFQNTVMD